MSVIISSKDVLIILGLAPAMVVADVELRHLVSGVVCLLGLLDSGVTVTDRGLEVPDLTFLFPIGHAYSGKR